MNGQKADLVFTDPPYNVDYEGYTEEKLKIEGDKMTAAQFERFLLAVKEPPVGLGCLLVTDREPRFGWRFAVGRSRPRGGLPQFPGDDLKGACDRDGEQGGHETAEGYAAPEEDKVRS